MDGLYIFVEGHHQSGKTTSVIATVNHLQKSNGDKFPVPDLEIYIVTFSVGLDTKNPYKKFAYGNSV